MGTDLDSTAMNHVAVVGADHPVIKRKSEGRQVRPVYAEVAAVPDGEPTWEGELERVKDDPEDDGPFQRRLEFRASNATVDRYGDILRPDGWDLKNYRRNPVFLWSHDSFSPPIGRSVREYVADSGQAKGAGDESWKRKELRQVIMFAPRSVNPLAMTIFRLYKHKYLRAVSVGFLPKERLLIDDQDERDKLGLGSYGIVYTKMELLELSGVTIPANPDALQINAFRAAAEADCLEALDMDLLEANALLPDVLKRLWTDVRGRTICALDASSGAFVCLDVGGEPEEGGATENDNAGGEAAGSETETPQEAEPDGAAPEPDSSENAGEEGEPSSDPAPAEGGEPEGASIDPIERFRDFLGSLSTLVTAEMDALSGDDGEDGLAELYAAPYRADHLEARLQALELKLDDIASVARGRAPACTCGAGRGSSPGRDASRRRPADAEPDQYAEILRGISDLEASLS